MCATNESLRSIARGDETDYRALANRCHNIQFLWPVRKIALELHIGRGGWGGGLGWVLTLYSLYSDLRLGTFHEGVGKFKEIIGSP